MYTDKDYKTKKELVADFKAGKKIFTFQPGGFFESKKDGPICLEGPHYPKPHKWYASAVIKDGCIVSIK